MASPKGATPIFKMDADTVPAFSSGSFIAKPSAIKSAEQSLKLKLPAAAPNCSMIR